MVTQVCNALSSVDKKCYIRIYIIGRIEIFSGTHISYHNTSSSQCLDLIPFHSVSCQERLHRTLVVNEPKFESYYSKAKYLQPPFWAQCSPPAQAYASLRL